DVLIASELLERAFELGVGELARHRIGHREGQLEVARVEDERGRRLPEPQLGSDVRERVGVGRPRKRKVGRALQAGERFFAKAVRAHQSFVKDEPGGMSPLFRLYLEYFRPSFHPSDIDCAALLESWRREFDEAPVYVRSAAAARTAAPRARCRELTRGLTPDRKLADDLIRGLGRIGPGHQRARTKSPCATPSRNQAVTRAASSASARCERLPSARASASPRGSPATSADSTCAIGSVRSMRHIVDSLR